MRNITSLALLLLSSLGVACSGGGGGDSTGGGPQIPASVPNGSGLVAIDMAGLWTIQNAQVIDSNAGNPAPPINGTPFEMEPDRIVSIGGLSVAPDALAILLNSPLLTYVNQLDGRTLYYSVVVDRRASGGSREEIAVAGGTIDANTIAVESFSSSQTVSDPEPVFVRSRYTLVRVGGAPAWLGGDGWQAERGDDPFAPAFGAR